MVHYRTSGYKRGNVGYANNCQLSTKEELSIVHCQLSIFQNKNRLVFTKRFLVLALPIFPASHPASIVGADELNFCVRDGNRWTLVAINTNYLFSIYLEN